jgi:hypothetical protein
MTPQQLISEGRKLEHPCVLLRPMGTGAVAAVWHERDKGEIESTGHRCWLSVDIRNIPGLRRPVRRYIFQHKAGAAMDLHGGALGLQCGDRNQNGGARD